MISFSVLNVDFLISDDVPSEASYSRLISRLSETDIIENINDITLIQAIEEGFVQDENIAVDACHFEARDQAPAKEKKAKPEPKKRGRKRKEEKDNMTNKRRTE